MFMMAVVVGVQRGRLQVLDLSTKQGVIVHTPHAYRFRVGDFVRIWYSGAMTMSMPHQITAISISPLLGPGPWCGWC